jgi:hypothetical protein
LPIDTNNRKEGEADSEVMLFRKFIQVTDNSLLPIASESNGEHSGNRRR